MVWRAPDTGRSLERRTNVSPPPRAEAGGFDRGGEERGGGDRFEAADAPREAWGFGGSIPRPPWLDRGAISVIGSGFVPGPGRGGGIAGRAADAGVLTGGLAFTGLALTGGLAFGLALTGGLAFGLALTGALAFAGLALTGGLAFVGLAFGLILPVFAIGAEALAFGFGFGGDFCFELGALRPEAGALLGAFLVIFAGALRFAEDGLFAVFFAAMLVFVARHLRPRGAEPNLSGSNPSTLLRRSRSFRRRW